MRAAAVASGLWLSLVSCASSKTVAPEAAPVPEPTAVVDPAEPESPTIDESPAEEPAPATDPEPSRKGLHPLVEGELELLADITELDAQRKVGAWRHFDPAVPGEADIIVAIVVPEDGKDTAQWGVEHMAVVHHVATPWQGEEAPTVGLSLTADDFDDDGEPEIHVTLGEEIMCPGGGPNVITTLMMFDTDPPLAEVLRTELSHEMLASPLVTEAEAKFVDLDGDGHRDVRIRYVTDDPDDGRTSVENRWRYDSDEDRWSLLSGDYDRFGCDW